ncbi:MAG TPA: CDP-alcohol phosphatidyltransferase family protein [Candidatus Eisenbacteria bacterium]|nr:CDP-alcohol phosphatidyltransferase family protein [Candidatus Eisenbacteria bacterium]
MASPRTPEPTTIVERFVYFKRSSKAIRRLVVILPAWVTPNMVTLLRALLAAPIYWALSTERYGAALAIFTAAMALDVLDGAIAHVRDMHTTAGAFLDPLADKLIFCAAFFAVWRSLPAWIVVFAGTGVLFAAAITLSRISTLVRIRRPDGPSLSRAVEAKPAGKIKTVFDALSAVMIMIGLAVRSTVIVECGGVLLIAGSVAAALVHFFHGRNKKPACAAGPR